eukprot:TRINITY_DN18908_c0_g1_i1.p1 TRINITY_DN18908_c0_g1~~TRINITY_DN18908_c0_g1_i1.p1  ORF type:complete len:593 (+),score=127.04 TRINITY_DN18908_c0_g1_i1:56-1780(+)
MAVLLLAAAVSGTELKLMVPMRDGFNLSTWVWYPDTGAAQKTFIYDTSTYGHGGEAGAEQLAKQLGDGYGAIMQDMRGTGKSKGEDFTLWHASSNDTYDTLTWLSKQNYSNGAVYQVGTSADGIGALLGWQEAPPQLQKLSINWATIHAHGMPFPGGAYRESLNTGWLSAIFPEQAHSLIREVKSNEGPGQWWDAVNATRHCDKATFSSVLVGGWYDIFLSGNLGAYDCFNNGKTKYTRLLVEACGHCLAHGCPIYLAEDLTVSLGNLLTMDMFNDLTPPEQIKNITFYVMGAGDKNATFIDPTAPGNYYTSLERWPTYTPITLYLNSDSSASTERQNIGADKEILFNPLDPVRTKGGNNLLIMCGAENQQEVEDRADVLSFTTDVLDEDVAVTGPLSARLFVSSDRKDTDFTAKLTDVYPDGKSRLINDGIVRMRWRQGETGGALPNLMTPGQIYEIEVSMWNTSYIFPAGHKIRLSVSSSNYPRFDVNPNTGRPLSDDSIPLPALNKLYLGGDHASYFTLPVVQKSQLPKVDVRKVVDDWLAARPESYRAAAFADKRKMLEKYVKFPKVDEL